MICTPIRIWKAGAAFNGWRNGLLKEFVSSVGLLVGLLVAATCYSSFGEYLAVEGSETNMFTGQCHAFFEGDAQLVEGLHEFRVNLLVPLLTLLAGGVGVVRYGLIVDGRQVDVRPVGLLQGEPVAVGLEAEVEEPFGLALLGRDEAVSTFFSIICIIIFQVI